MRKPSNGKTWTVEVKAQAEDPLELTKSHRPFSHCIQFPTKFHIFACLVFFEVMALCLPPHLQPNPGSEIAIAIIGFRRKMTCALLMKRWTYSDVASQCTSTGHPRKPNSTLQLLRLLYPNPAQAPRLLTLAYSTHDFRVLPCTARKEPAISSPRFLICPIYEDFRWWSPRYACHFQHT